MQRTLILVLAASMAFGVPAAAEQRTKIASSGSWSLYRVTDYAIADGGDHIKMPSGCLAETGNDKARFAFAMVTAKDAAQVPELSGTVFGQVTASAWHFRPRTGDIIISDANVNLHVVGSLYDDDMITFSLGGDGQIDPGLLAAVDVFEGPLALTDFRGNKLATFPSNGLKAIFRKMVSCGSKGGK